MIATLGVRGSTEKFSGDINIQSIARWVSNFLMKVATFKIGEKCLTDKAKDGLVLALNTWITVL